MGLRLRLAAASRASSALLVVCLLASCTVVTQEQVDRQRSRIDDLQERILRLERELQQSRVTPPPAAAPAPELAARLAQIGQLVETLDGELRDLAGKVDALGRARGASPAAESPRLQAAEERLHALAERLAALEAKGAAPSPAAPLPAPAPAPQPPSRAPAARPASPKASPQELYDRAYATYKRGSYDEAREAFRDYVRLHPDTNLTDNALFWIGESYYEQQQYEQAILEYDKVVQKFPTGDKVASALLKQAFAFDAIGDPTDARILLKKILREHPTSEQATIAKKKLDILGE